MLQHELHHYRTYTAYMLVSQPSRTTDRPRSPQFHFFTFSLSLSLSVTLSRSLSLSLCIYNMYVCIYIRMYVCIFVCMYVYVWMDVYIYTYITYITYTYITVKSQPRSPSSTAISLSSAALQHACNSGHALESAGKGTSAFEIQNIIEIACVGWDITFNQTQTQAMCLTGSRLAACTLAGTLFHVKE
jgi:hypothetical protein